MYHKDGFNLEIDEAGRILYVPDPKLQVRAACYKGVYSRSFVLSMR